MTRTCLEKPSYYRELYHHLLKRLDDDMNWYPDKRDRDILLTLMEKANPQMKRKWLRKLVAVDVKEIVHKHFLEIMSDPEAIIVDEPIRRESNAEIESQEETIDKTV